MLTRIRNSVRVERPFVDIPSSGVKKGIADVLKREGFIWDWKELDEEPAPQIRIELKYGPNGEQVIQTIKRLSKPGRRMYAGSRELKPVLGGLGIRIISTSKGVISDREARRDKVGGELICEVA
jgi:small subunit ribosomal protein S8